jgi:predicted SnoaL-like aldol condensation-catalyzing enzyme
MGPEQVVRRMYEAANRHDLTAIDEIFAPDFYSHAMGKAGRDPIRAAWGEIMRRYPDLRLEPVEMLCSGDRVAVWARVFHGEGEPATMMEMIRVAEGRIAEVWGVSNLRWRDAE